MHQGYLGLMKSETDDRIMRKITALSAKMYALLTEDEVEMKRAKGDKKYIVEKNLKFENYVKCLFDAAISTCNQNCIRSKHHNVYTVSEKKNCFTM